VDPLRREFLGAPDVIHVVGIAAVDEDVFGLKVEQKAGDGFVHGRRRDHQPDRPRLLQLGHEILE
jgi:hypothetical protein